jgi:ribosomal protein S18 acetylase RimI-like enzyme
MSPSTVVNIRPIQLRDLEEVTRIADESADESTDDTAESLVTLKHQLRQLRYWYGVLKCVSWFPNPLRDFLCAYVAEQNNRLHGLIQVTPFNRTRSTWRVDQIWVDAALQSERLLPSDVGSQLLRHCFQAIWEARTWLVEVNVNDKSTLALYRQNGFQTLAHTTYWTISPDILQLMAGREPDLPNLLPVSNADACLLYQLDTQSMPSFVRQVYDRHVTDFKVGLMETFGKSLNRWFRKTDQVSGYVFEPQRKAAIGYFDIQNCRDGSHPHQSHLTVHPAYTWLYPELVAQMARVVGEYPTQSLQLASTDYQPEREEFLEQIGATRIEHTLMMSRSVWHKIRESKFSLEALQLAEVLQGLQPTRKPVPGRFSLDAPTNLDCEGTKPPRAAEPPEEPTC